MKSTLPKSKPLRGTNGNGPPATSSFILDPQPHHHHNQKENQIQKKLLNDLIRKFDQDMLTLNTRLSDLQGAQLQQPLSSLQSSDPSNSSLFVHSLRSSIDTSRQLHGTLGHDSASSSLQQSQYEIIVTKYEILDQLLKKLNDLNRAILAKTDLTSAGGGKVRRASRGSDLFNFPTHLLLIDRLVDLHTLSQRSVLVRNPSGLQAGEEAESFSAEKEKAEKEIALMKQRHEKEMKTLTSQLTESQMSCQQLQSQLNRSSQQIEELKSDIITLATRKSSPRSPRHTMPPSPALRVVGTSSGDPSAAAAAAGAESLVKKLEAEIMELKCRLEVSEQKNQSFEEKIELNAATTQHVLTALLKLKKMTTSVETSGAATGSFLEFSRHPPMAEELKTPLEDLFHSLHSTLTSHSQSLLQLEEEKKSLRLELSSLQEKEIQSKKYYDENTQHLLDQQTQREVEMKRLCELCQEYKEELEEGRRQCQEMRGQLGGMGRLTERIEQLQRDVLEADDRRYALDRTLSESQTEIASLRSLNENLMRKLKKLSCNAHDSGAKDFAETFEEVMREEMMAMKTAFEAKLRVAVEERDTATRRHQTELMRLQSRVQALGTT